MAKTAKTRDTTKAAKIEPIHIEEAAKLKALFDSRAGMSQERFGHDFEIGSQGMVWQYLNARSALNQDAALKFAKGLGCSVADFSPRLAAKLKEVVSLSSNVLQSRELAESDDSSQAEQIGKDIIAVQVFDARASMGLGLSQPEHDTVADHMRLTRDWVRKHLPSISSPGNLAVLSACGDSMSPTFADGDILLVDRAIHEIKIDAVYVLALNNELYVKRIQRRITDGAIIIKSDNPLYDPVVVDNGERENLRVLGRVVWAWNGHKL